MHRLGQGEGDPGVTCGDLREYVFAFLDDQLDAPLSIELQRHLERCHVCAREVEIERTIRRQLGEGLEAAEPGAALDEKSLRRTVVEITMPKRAPAVYRRRLAIAAALAGALLVAVAWRARTDTGDPAEGGFTRLVVNDFLHFLEEGGPLQVESSDRHIVSEWLQQRTLLAVVLPVFDGPRSQLVGGRKCKIDGRQAAFAVFDINGKCASLVVVAGGRGDLAGMSSVRRRAERYWVDHVDGHTVVVSEHGKLLYAAVSTLPEEELFCLMVDVNDEGD